MEPLEKERIQRKKVESTLAVEDVADPYIISLVYRKLEDKSLANFRLYEIQQKYLEVFREIMENQLDYYVRSNRVDSSLNIGEHRSFHTYPLIFSRTFRHDKKRINDAWVTLAEKVVKLEQAKEFGIVNALDSINHAIHNGGGYVITKLDNWMKLYKVIMLKCEEVNPNSRMLVALGSREVRQLYREVTA